MGQNRRTFLRTLGLATTGTFMLGSLASPELKAAPKGGVPRSFIFCYFNGGWDQLMSLDTRDPKVFTDSSAALKKYQIQLGWDRLPKNFDDGTPIYKRVIRPPGSRINFGPAMAPFAKHYDVSCVVRGVMMDTVAHDIGRRYFITGEMPTGLNAKGSSWGTRIVAQQGELTQIPNLVIRAETYNKNHPAFATGLKATSASDLVNTLKKGPDALPKELQLLLNDYRSTNMTCDATELNEEGMMSLLKLAQKKATSLVDSGLSSHFDFLNKKDPKMVSIAKRYGIKSMSSGEAQAALAFQAIKNNLAQTVTIELARGLDTHFNNWSTIQPNNLYMGFRALSVLVDDLKKTPHPKLKGKSLLDNTTIVCFSEFARTPMINSREGRDHFLVSSCLMIGAGVPKNRVIGATANVGMSSFKIDPNSGQTSSSGVNLNPQNILASVMASAGYKTDELRDEKPLPCLQA